MDGRFSEVKDDGMIKGRAFAKRSGHGIAIVTSAFNVRVKYDVVVLYSEPACVGINNVVLRVEAGRNHLAFQSRF
jgi:hypothetical protein